MTQSNETIRVPPPHPSLRSCLCTQARLESPSFTWWSEQVGYPKVLHRKRWEFCFVAQVLHEHGMLAPGKRGLGFAVGKEPMPALFASFGCEVVATDLPPEKAGPEWTSTNQHATSIEPLHRPWLCSQDVMRQRVAFRFVDMNDIPEDLTGFDFVWSCCAFEHLGSIRKGKRFIQRMVRCLKPGGIAVHTTEFNVGSNWWTLHRGPAVIYRRRDFETMKADLERAGHTVIDFDFDPGSGPADQHVDEPPYPQEVHLKMRFGGHVTTSGGIIVRAGEHRQVSFWERLWPWAA